MNQKVKTITKGIVLIAIALLVVYFSRSNQPKNIHTQINFLNVGQGDAILIEQGKNQTLIDGGPNQKVIEKLGKEIEVTDKTIETLIVTHPDADHINGLIEVLSKYKVVNTIDSGYECKKPICKTWQNETKDTNKIQGNTNTIIPIQDGEIEILWPNTQKQIKEKIDHNEYSIITCVTVFNFSFLLTGDASKEIEELLLEKENGLGKCSGSPILKAGHHGSKHSTSPNLLKEIKPTHMIISAGKNNSYGHPHFDTMERISDEGIPILRTDEQGTITFTITKEKSMQITTRHGTLQE